VNLLLPNIGIHLLEIGLRSNGNAPVAFSHMVYAHHDISTYFSLAFLCIKSMMSYGAQSASKPQKAHHRYIPAPLSKKADVVRSPSLMANFFPFTPLRLIVMQKAIGDKRAKMKALALTRTRTHCRSPL
jgi:hypothetical protein